MCKLKDAEFDRLIDLWFQRRQESLCLRFGQALFDALTEIKPDLAERVRGTSIDPFYDDRRIQDFLQWIRTEERNHEN